MTNTRAIGRRGEVVPRGVRVAATIAANLEYIAKFDLADYYLEHLLAKLIGDESLPIARLWPSRAAAKLVFLCRGDRNSVEPMEAYALVFEQSEDLHRLERRAAKLATGRGPCYLGHAKPWPGHAGGSAPPEAARTTRSRPEEPRVVLAASGG